MNIKLVKHKRYNLGSYKKYCQKLEELLNEEKYNNSNNIKKIKELNSIKKNLDNIDLGIDFLDSMNGILAEYDEKNNKIEKKIIEIEKKIIEIEKK